MKILLTICLFLLPATAGAIDDTDNLYLYGKIEKYDPQKAEVVITVETTSCKGRRTFKVSEQLPDTIVGQHRYFAIDSSTCEGNNIYKVTTSLKGD